MSTITFDDVSAEALGARMGREAARFKPKTRFKVILEELEEGSVPDDPAAELMTLAERITRKARERGLTDEMLKEILSEI
ncbi:hypothetical protein [Endothiovibrio diazotrophicus]